MTTVMNPNGLPRRTSKLARLETRELIDDWGLQPLQIEEMQIVTMKNTILKNDWDLPIKFNLEKELKIFRSAGILRRIEIRRTSDIFERFFYSKHTEKLVTLLFWISFCRKNPENVNNPPDLKVSILDKLRQRMSKRYSKLLFEIPPPKTEVMDYILFSAIYLSFVQYYRTFYEERMLFNINFLFEIFHICLYEINGVIVSDMFISHTLERIFNQRMLNYLKDDTEEKESLNKESQDKSTEASVSSMHKHSFLGIPLVTDRISLENSVISDSKDHTTFRDRLKRQLTPRVVKFEPLGKKMISRDALSFRSLSPKSKDDKKEDYFLNDFDTQKSLKEASSIVTQTKKKKLLKKKNFLNPTKQDADIDQIIDSEGLAGKKFHCGQVSPRVRDFLGVTRASIVNDRKEILFHRMRTKLSPENYPIKDSAQLALARQSTIDHKIQKLDMHQILIDKMVRTRMRKSKALFRNEVFNKYALMIHEQPILKKETKLIEDLLGYKLTLEECDKHMNSIIHEQGFQRVKDLNDNEEYFKHFKKHVHRERKPVPKFDEIIRRYSILITEGNMRTTKRSDGSSRENSLMERSVRSRKAFHSPQPESRGSVHTSQDSEFDFLNESNLERDRVTIDTIVHRNNLLEGRLYHKSKKHKYINDHSAIANNQETDARIAEIMQNLNKKKRNLNRGLTAIKKGEHVQEGERVKKGE